MVKYNEQSLDATFGALADPTRRAILARLARGEARMRELAEPFRMSLPAVSKHLKVLEKAGLVRRRRSGRVHRFTVDPTHIESARSWIESHQKFWEQQLDALDAYLKTVSSEEGEHVDRHTTRK